METLICEHLILLTTYALINYMESCYNIFFFMWKLVKLLFFLTEKQKNLNEK